ncbi:hypothetical protein ACFPVX_03390 [Cohnella faecalis]|uniref:Uncharacterized protein n=1 Tax=Cohnella faecalis TaxID=2315694 RepID=A0A398CJC9_9BACL|nr:hypothetical protein [Cohnella faecalis]RIE03426.1 hypothetical protein D3H35_12230 [Cohnella faecalis]
MNTGLLIILVVVVMVAAVAATLMVGFSRSNNQEDTGYTANTGRKWGRLIALYAVSIILVAILFIALMD